MTIKNLLFRFLLVYAGLMIVAWLLLVLLRFENFIGLDAAMLFGAITVVCTKFAKKNGRFFTNEEKRQVVFGMLGIDLVIQFFLLLLPLLLPNAKGIPPGPLLVMLAIVGVLHLMVIFIFVTLEKRFLIKQGIIEG